jgi:hypothetical protein
MTNIFLKLEMRLVLLRYGRRAIVEALADMGEQTPEDIERELAAAQEKKTSRRSVPKLPVDLIADACRDRPEIAEILRTFVTRFENRSFLPKLRDIERFLDRVGFPHGRMKSRRAAVGHVIKALSQINADELRRLAALPSPQGESDYALLAREIMGGDRPKMGRPRVSPPSEDLPSKDGGI